MATFDYNDIFEAMRPARKSWKPKKVTECDGAGAGAAGAGAGAISAGGGGGEAASAPVVDNATASTEVLGKCDHSHGGYFGPGCFHVPSRCAVPFHRWEVGNGGSKRKKTKKGKDKKYAYEKGMKVVIDMLKEADSTVDPSKVKIPKKIVKGRLKRIAKAIRSMRDIEIAEKKFEADAPKKISQMPSKFAKAKEAFLDIGAFLKDVCQGKYKASWFTLSLLAVAVVYVLSPVDLIPDAIPLVGWIDDATVIMWVYQALKDEFEKWKEAKSQIDIDDELDSAISARDNAKKPVAGEASIIAERKMTRPELDEFYDSLRSGVVEFDFIKKDGSRHHARGTLNPNQMPSRSEIEKIYAEQGVDLAELESRLQARQDYMPYFWDLDNNGYRQFHVSRFEGITPNSGVEKLNEDTTNKKSVRIWVDDVRPAPDNSWTTINSVDQFIALVNDIGVESIEILDLDHDAGDFQEDGGDYIRCLDFLEFLGARDIKVKIHSANPVGVQNMRAIIQKNNWIEVR